MDERRKSKIARLIQKELGEIFRLETQKTQGVIISVTDVRPAPDLSSARIFLSFFPSEKGAEILKNITKNAAQVRYELGKRCGSQLRVIPELLFQLDRSLDYLERIDNLLAQDKEKTGKNTTNPQE
ncbi:MAG: 30S ribosome-binding factor RbfA [Porphyromonas sp.]|nr:30S ribosome-binding factor RbfA [Porphyromonas sp.]